MLDRPILDRHDMGERPNDVAGEGRPDRDDGAALSIENDGRHDPDAELDTSGSLTGTTIGHYLVGERLGGGAMAAVYRAQDQILDREVAIKVLLPGADAVMQKRFRREARLVSTLVHPHVVRTLQVGRSGGIIYIAMELVEGASLGSLLERYGKLTVGDAARILAPIAEALAYAHEKGIVHRDVKPSNILLQRAAPGAKNSVTIGLLRYPVIPLLSDFGIARALDAPELTSAGRTIGTPAFMAPEQCAGSADIDGRADVYALGAVLYRCLVGRAPFAGTTTQILHAHVYDPLLIPDAVAEALPAPVVRLMARAMMKEPAQRFERVEGMAAELRRIAELPEASISAAAAELVDPTMTMASLPVAQSSISSTSRVLVPAVAPLATTPRPSPLRSLPRTTAQGATLARSIPVAPPPSSRPRARGGRWGMMALVGAFAVLVVLAVGMLVNSVWPGLGEENPIAGVPTATPATVAQNGTPQIPVIAPNVSPDVTETVATPARNEQPTGQTNRPTPEPTPSGPTPTPQPPLRDLEPKWHEAQAAFAERDWEAARDALNLIQRTIELSDLPFEDEIDPLRLQEMLAISNLGMAIDAIRVGKWEDAIEYVNKAMTFAPSVATLTSMVDVLTELADLKGDNSTEAQERRNALRAELAELFATYANRLAREQKFCDAVIQVDNALLLTETKELQELQIRLGDACVQQDAANAVAELGGSILYSTGGNDAPFIIWRLPIARSSNSPLRATLLVENAAQPQMSPNGNMLAYYSHQEGADGLYGVRMSVALTTLGERIDFSPFPEDSRDSPPSWNPANSQLVYSTQRGIDAPRIYVTSADANTSAREMGFGKDPAWGPAGQDFDASNVIVFNGPEMGGGGEPGLRAMSASGDGSDRYALTSPLNGNDQRPVWSSDGKYIVFMSKDRVERTNWEVYRMEWATKRITLLTDGLTSQEGLPAISPDNKWVVFVSDRDGQWKLYFVHIDGGPVHFLSEMNGQPISWLEHGVQWVK